MITEALSRHDAQLRGDLIEVFNPTDTADNLKKYGGFIPGIRPGEKTAEYIDYVLTRITLIGALYLTVICLLPEFLILQYQVAHQQVGVDGEGFAVARDAGEAEYAVSAERLQQLEGDLRRATGLIYDVDVPHSRELLD